MALFVGSFGDIRLTITSFDHEGGRDWAVHSPTRGDSHVIQDRGLRLRRTNCEISFAGAGYDDAFRAFDELASSSEARLFTHPVRGSYLAVCEGWRYEASAEAQEIRGSCSFLELEAPKAVSPLGAGVSPVAGPEAVDVAAEQADAALADAGLTSSAPSDAAGVVHGWSSSDSELTTQTVQSQLASAVSEIDGAITSLNLAASHLAWRAYRQMLLLRRKVFQAAQAVAAETDRIVEMAVPSDTPLLALAARLYGGSLALERAEQIRQLNGIRQPGMLRAGLKLRVVAP